MQYQITFTILKFKNLKLKKLKSLNNTAYDFLLHNSQGQSKMFFCSIIDILNQFLFYAKLLSNTYHFSYLVSAEIFMLRLL